MTPTIRRERICILCKNEGINKTVPPKSRLERTFWFLVVIWWFQSETNAQCKSIGQTVSMKFGHIRLWCHAEFLLSPLAPSFSFFLKLFWSFCCETIHHSTKMLWVNRICQTTCRLTVSINRSTLEQSTQYHGWKSSHVRFGGRTQKKTKKEKVERKRDFLGNVTFLTLLCSGKWNYMRVDFHRM